MHPNIHQCLIDLSGKGVISPEEAALFLQAGYIRRLQDQGDDILQLPVGSISSAVYTTLLLGEDAKPKEGQASKLGLCGRLIGLLESHMMAGAEASWRASNERAAESVKVDYPLMSMDAALDKLRNVGWHLTPEEIKNRVVKRE